MSLEQIRRVWALPDVEPLRRLLLLALADLANDEGARCYPSQRTLSRLTGISERYVRTLLNDLLLAGHLELLSPGTSHKSASYRLQLPETVSGSHNLQEPASRNQSHVFPEKNAQFPEPSSADPSESDRDPKSAGAHAHEGAAPAQTKTGNGELRPSPEEQRSLRAWLANYREQPAADPQLPTDDAATLAEITDRRRRELATLASDAADAEPDDTP